jgi:hypothetical protein
MSIEIPANTLEAQTIKTLPYKNQHLIPNLGGGQDYCAVFLKIEDNGLGSLAHHLPVGFLGDVVFASATVWG